MAYSSLLASLRKKSRIDGLSLPSTAYPSLVRMIGDLPDSFGARSSHDVQVVHVEAGRGDTRAVPAVRHQYRVAIMDLFKHFDLMSRRRRRTHKPKARLAAGPGSDFEVVDLFQLRLGLTRLVVLVCRVGGPVASRSDHLAGDDLGGIQRSWSSEVPHLPAGLAGTAQLDGHLGGGQITQRRLQYAV